MLKKSINKLKRIKSFIKKEFFKSKHTRIYTDNSKGDLVINLKPGLISTIAFSTIFIIDYKKKKLEKEVLYSDLTLLSLLKNYNNDFQSVLDIGSAAGNCSDIFEFLDKKVTRIEHNTIFKADYRSDYITTNFDKKFDCIWASQVLEHQRNVGLFLNKCFDDLNENGILAITVPCGPPDIVLEMGHSVIFNPINLIYHLVLAGFDCSKVKLKIYNNNIGIILKKKYNGINQKLSMASTLPVDFSDEGELNINGKNYSNSAMSVDESFENFYKSMPPSIKLEHITYFDSDNINWDGPI